MAQVKVINVEVLSPTQIKVFYDHPVKVNSDYYSTLSYSISPTLSIFSIESQTSSVLDYSVINLNHNMLNYENYTITVFRLLNLLDESFNPSFNSYGFVGFSTEPMISSMTALNETTIRLTFDRIMDETTSTDVDNYTITSQYTGHSLSLKSIDYNGSYVDISINEDIAPMTDGFDHDVYISNVKDYNGNKVVKNTYTTFEGICTTLTRMTAANYYSSEKKIFLSFDRQIDESTVLKNGSFEIKSTDLGFGTEIFYNNPVFSNDGYNITIDITEGTNSLSYTLTCSSSLRDIFGNIIDPLYNSNSFNIIGDEPDLLYMTFEGNSIINLHFSENIKDDSVSRSPNIYGVYDGSTTVLKVLSIEKNVVSLLVSPLKENTRYEIRILAFIISDTAYNKNSVLISASATTPESFDVDDSKIDLYEFLPLSYRDMDQSTLLKRYMGAFQLIIDDLFTRIRDLKDRPVLDTIKDEHLYYVRSLYGWRGYEFLLNKLSYDKLRELYANSESLFKRRGAGEAVSESVKLILEEKTYEVGYFDDKFVLGDSYLLHHGEGYDSPSLDTEGIHTIYLKVVDPDDVIDHKCLEFIAEIWKPSIERFFIEYLLIYENFDENFTKDNYILRNYLADTENTSYTVSDGYLDLIDDTEVEVFQIESKQSYKFENISFHATLKPKNVTTGVFGLFTNYNHNGLAEHYIYDLVIDTNQLLVRKEGVTLDTVELSDFGIYLANDRVTNMKIEKQREISSATDFYNVYIDGNLVLSSSNSADINPGTFGVYHGPDAQIEVHSMQCSRIPSNIKILN